MSWFHGKKHRDWNYRDWRDYGSRIKQIRLEIMRLHLVNANAFGKTTQTTRQIELALKHFEKARSQLEEIMFKQLKDIKPDLELFKLFYGQPSPYVEEDEQNKGN